MTRPLRRAICWLRRDLRLADHPALAAATRSADEVAVCFVFDRNILDRLPQDDRRVAFIEQSLREVDAKLRERGSALFVRHGDPVDEIPKLARELQADAVFAAQDYEPYARLRDARVAEAVPMERVRDHVLIEPGTVLGKGGTPLRVYTPFARAWREAFRPRADTSVREPDLSALMKTDPCYWESGFRECALWARPGEDAAQARLREFRDKLGEYAATRDFPATDGTSVLSMHLRFGTLSIRAAARAALESGADKWLAELIWREFYQDILWHCPEVATVSFQGRYRDMRWPGTHEQFEVWCRGETGYPIVDAAMRCLNETGWMHNRLRMIVASFLTKDLLVDYRLGEAYFARQLLDFELASNNGGWQWAASVGCDAQPYFRVFNPVLQGRKFDADGEFVRRWIPELSELPGDSIHAPWDHPLEISGTAYPPRIVDHAVQREAAIRLFAGFR